MNRNAKGSRCAKLLDFGLAKLVAAEQTDATQTADGFVVGTARVYGAGTGIGKAV